MKFDTLETFLHAVYNKAGESPSSVSKALPAHLQYQACSQIVDLMRAAFHVHEQASAQIGPGDSLLGYRLEQAKRELPEGWQIVVQVKAGELHVDLYDANDERQQVPTVQGDEPSGVVADALKYACDRTMVTEAPTVTKMPVPSNPETQLQLAAVMLKHGTPEQQREALVWASKERT
jgi:hypothetical protein